MTASEDEVARARHPGIAADGFAAFLAARRAKGASAEHAADLLVTFGAARGDPVALREIDIVLRDLGPALSRLDASAAFLDEVRQLTRVRLLVAVDGEPPKIAGYAGAGPLRAWMRVTATRVALDLKRRTANDVGDDVLVELAASEPDPELRHLKTLYRAEYRDALIAAITALPDRQRTVLRLYYVEGVRLAELGRLYDVHESTASRWIAQAADEIAAAARQRLTERLGTSPASLDSITRLVRSQLDVSIARLLR